MNKQEENPFNYNIFLIGFMGVGKSAVAKALRGELGMEMAEMDGVLAEREGMSISDIFRTYGEEYFRSIETELLTELKDRKGLIVSCGGGTAMREENVRKMKENGKVVLLRAKPQTVLERVKDSRERPLLKGNKNVAYIAALMEERSGRYEAAADAVIDTDCKTVRQICEELIYKLKGMDEEDVSNVLS